MARPVPNSRPRVGEAGGRLTAGALLAALVVASVVAPSNVVADVLQVENGAVRWVAGHSPNPVGGEARVPGSGPAYTEVVTSAGPEEWRGAIARLAARYDISPALLEAVIWQESRWRAAATSSAGAHGLAQLMPGTARQLGVDIHDPLANLEGGTRYLRMQLDSFHGDVEKALAAYNAGPGRVTSAGGVPRIPETQAYVAAIMARLSASVRR